MLFRKLVYVPPTNGTPIAMKIIRFNNLFPPAVFLKRNMFARYNAIDIGIIRAQDKLQHVAYIPAMYCRIVSIPNASATALPVEL
jgi:hypothetical protein